MRYSFLLIFSFSTLVVFSQSRQGKDRALFFAVAQYEDDRLQHLKQTITNANEIAEVLRDNYGFATEIVKNPSLDEIEEKLATYSEQYEKGKWDKTGQLLIFFSGHGVKEYNNGYFLPADANVDRILRTGLPYNTWRPFISEINCQHIMVAVDACYSVTFDPKWNTMTGNTLFKRVGELSETERVLENFKSYQSRIFFTSDAREDVVPGQSNFARKFLEGLSDLQYSSPFSTASKLFGEYIDSAQPSPKGGTFEKDDPRSAFLFFPNLKINVNSDRYTQRQKDIDAYKNIQIKASIDNCQQYLRDFPNGAFRTEVYTQLLDLQEDQEWEFATLKNSKESYQNYLKQYPSGRYSYEASRKIKQIEEASNKSGNSPYMVQIKTTTSADRLKEPLPNFTQLLAIGPVLYVYTKPYYKIRVAGFSSKQKADEALIKIKELGYNVAYVVKVDANEKHLPLPNITGDNSPNLIDNMIFVQGGTYQMGSDASDAQYGTAPVHEVSVNDYYISKYEVTFEEYDQYCKAKGIAQPADQGYGRGNRPVFNVQWYDAIEYCNWLSGQKGLQKVYQINKKSQDPNNTSGQYDKKKWIVTPNWYANGYRLPTEAEWEFAARSRGKNQKWAGTSNEKDLKSYVNGSENGDGYEKTAPVGSFEPNALGIYDMSGNVWEWCWDWYDEDYYKKSPVDNPKGNTKSYARALRGGSWSRGTLQCTERSKNFPDYFFRDYGFRICRNAN